MPEAKKQPKLHWFLLAYAVPQMGHTAFVSQFMSHDKKDMDIQTLGAARQNNKLPEGSALTSVSYLGRMTQDEFNPPPPIVPNFIKPTEAYMDGYHASVGMNETGNTPVNPFADLANPGAMSEQATEWADGLMAGCKRFGAVGKTSADL